MTATHPPAVDLRPMKRSLVEFDQVVQPLEHPVHAATGGICVRVGCGGSCLKSELVGVVMSRCSNEAILEIEEGCCGRVMRNDLAADDKDGGVPPSGLERIVCESHGTLVTPSRSLMSMPRSRLATGIRYSAVCGKPILSV